jgi:hypothetical protein
VTALDRTLTAPWETDSPELVTKTVTHLWAAQVVMPDGETIDLDVEDGRVTFDETRSPRVEASLTCRVPTDQATLDRIDPRTGARVTITAGYRRPTGGDDVQTMCDLGVRSRSVNRPRDTMTLTARSDEALIVDAASTIAGSVSAATTYAAITAVIQQVLPTVTPTSAAAPGPAVTALLYDDRWNAITDMADQIEARVYDNGLRAWYVAATAVVAAPAHYLTVGAAGTITDSTTDLDRESGWANYVWMRYRWRSGSTDNVVNAYRRITSGPYIASVGNVRAARIERDTSTTQTLAETAATSLLRRMVTRGRAFTIGAVSAYWLRPGHTVEVTLPLGDAEAHLVSGVEFNMAEGTMRVVTRLPDGNYTIGA